jgi:hypothetical protein
MTQDRTFEFKITLPIEKSDATDGKWIISGIASGTQVDREGDVITPEGIASLAEQINGGYIPFRDWHNDNTVLSDVGQAIKAIIEPNDDLRVEVELDQDHPTAQYMWKKLDQGKKFGMSVRGSTVNPFYDLDKSNGRRVRKHSNLLLTEISSTTKPMYTPSLGTVLKKAVDETSVPTGEEMPDTENGTTVEETQPLAPESSAPENDTAQETTEVEKAVTAETSRDKKKVARLVRLNREIASLITELGLDEDEATDSGETVETAKSAENAPAVTAEEIASLVKSTIEETTAPLLAEIEALKGRVPATDAPGVLLKSEAIDRDAILEAVKADPRSVLRLALATRHGELNKLG